MCEFEKRNEIERGKSVYVCLNGEGRTGRLITNAKTHIYTRTDRESERREEENRERFNMMVRVSKRMLMIEIERVGKNSVCE